MRFSPCLLFDLYVSKECWGGQTWAVFFLYGRVPPHNTFPRALQVFQESGHGRMGLLPNNVSDWLSIDDLTGWLCRFFLNVAALAAAATTIKIFIA